MKKYCILAGLIFLISCKKSETELFGLNFYFENPQPINDSELSKFPSKLRGLYVNNDSVFMRINEHLITLEYYNKVKINKLELDSLKEYFSFSEGKLINLKTNEVSETISKGDSIEIAFKNHDTIFSISNTQKIKRINGYLILNTKDSIFWKIRMLSLDKNVLKRKDIYSEEDLKRLDSLINKKSMMLDSTSYIISPTRKEFKNILKLKHLGNDDEFKKIKN